MHNARKQEPDAFTGIGRVDASQREDETPAGLFRLAIRSIWCLPVNTVRSAVR